MAPANIQPYGRADFGIKSLSAPRIGARRSWVVVEKDETFQDTIEGRWR
jgi:hypothetical protein